MLVGQYQSKLTDKDRIALPKKFREELGGSLILARWYDRCVAIISPTKWEELKLRTMGENRLVTKSVRDVERFISGMAYEVVLDSQGRFIVPDKLLSHSQIKQDAVFVGLQDRVELWALERWQEMEANIDELANEAIEKLAKK